MEPIRLDFTYTPEDFSEAIRAVQKHGLKRSAGGIRLDRKLIGWVVFVALAAAYLIWLKGGQAPKPPPPPAQGQQNLFKTILLPLLPWIGVFLVIWFVVFRLLRGAGTSLWEAEPTLQQPRTMTFDDEGVTVTQPASESRIHWSAFIGTIETEHVIILREPGSAFLAIPKRAATEQQLAGLREAFATHVVEPAGGFPVQPTAGRQ